MGSETTSWAHGLHQPSVQPNPIVIKLDLCLQQLRNRVMCASLPTCFCCSLFFSIKQFYNFFINTCVKNAEPVRIFSCIKFRLLPCKFENSFSVFNMKTVCFMDIWKCLLKCWLSTYNLSSCRGPLRWLRLYFIFFCLL